MRVINKKYLLIILLIGIIITGVIIGKPNKEVKLENVILKQEVNSKTFAMYKEDSDNNYVPVEGTKFPDGYVLNVNESKCIDNNGNEIKNALSYENDEVVLTTNKSSYCYLYFDKSLGLEIKEKNPNRLSEEEKGAMYRFQGQQTDDVRNYICFGTSDKEKCTSDTDKYMYRIIGIEAETGRVKVIKKEALENTYQWYTDNQTDIEFPQSKIYEAIKGDGFLTNIEYVPNGWDEKIDINTWTYGDMWSGDTLGARQTGEGLYLVETGQKGTIWDAKANEGDPGALSAVVGYENSQYKGDTVYYIRHNNENWTQSFEGKVSLMYLHDYHYSVSDTANCQVTEERYKECQTGWMHLSQNDSSVTGDGVAEWTMSRYGWNPSTGWFDGLGVNSVGCTNGTYAISSRSVRPVFFIDSSQTLKGGLGTIDNPYIIQE